MPFVAFDTVSKGPFHNYYGDWNIAAAAWPAGPTAGPVTGPGVPNHQRGDLYYNSNAGGGIAGLYVCTFPGAWGTAIWQQLGIASLDKRESLYIVGNVANGDTANNSDYLGGAGIYSALAACGASVRGGGRIYIREGAYGPAAGPDQVPGPTGSPYMAPYQISEHGFSTGVVVEGAGEGICTITNPVANTCPLWILDSVAETDEYPITLRFMSLVGNNQVDGQALGTGGGTVEVGFSGLFPAPDNVARAKNNVTLEHMVFDGGGNTLLSGGDYSALYAVNTALYGADDLKVSDAHVQYSAGGAAPSLGQMIIGPLGGGGSPSNRVEMFRVRVDNPPQAPFVAPGLYAGYMVDSNITDCEFSHNTDGGVKMDQCKDVAVTGCRAIMNTIVLPGASGAGFYLETCVECRLVSCYAMQNVSGGEGPSLTGGEDFLLITCGNCAVESCVSEGIVPAGNVCVNNGFTLAVCNNCVVDGCVSFGHGDAEPPSVFPAAGIGFDIALAQNVIVVGCDSHDNGVNGFRVDAGTYVQVNDCNANTNGSLSTTALGHGISVGGIVPTRVLVNDCIGNYNTGFGAYLAVSAVRCEIVGGAYIANTGTPATGPYVNQVYDAVGGPTTNELSHFQFQ